MQAQSTDAAGAGDARLVNSFANDPGAEELPLAPVPPPAGPAHFAIPGWSGQSGLFLPGTLEFQAGQLAVVLDQVFATWCELFADTVIWQSGVPRLPITPRAGQDLNAYYDRQGLHFFFHADPVTQQTIYTCESSDIVAHECGHAILDAEHPDYWDSLLTETAAFHEAFGDISAILVTLNNPAVRAAILKENAGDLAKSNAVTRIAEQLARGLFNAGKRDAVVSARALRDLADDFSYRDPDQLPPRAPAAKLSSESHSFSRIFSGAFYDLLVGIYEQCLKEDSALVPDVALTQAVNVSGRLLAQGLVLAPKGDAPFKTIAACMFTVNAREFAGQYFGPLRKAFVDRGVLEGGEAETLQQTRGASRTQTSGLGTASGSIGTPRLGVAAAQPGEEIPSQIRQWLQLPQLDFRLLADRLKPDRGRVLHYVAPRELWLKGNDLGVAADAIVAVTDAVAINLDDAGQMLSAHQYTVDRAHETRIRNHVANLIQRGRVYAATQGERIDPAVLMERKQPYYVGFDESGQKRIRRGFIACARH
ncbi:MAG: hypothetical protein HY782_28525 [Chloroflexi bacterium]|nr:hypothetical protein [Chloroflexota bacterium]